MKDYTLLAGANLFAILAPATHAPAPPTTPEATIAAASGTASAEHMRFRGLLPIRKGSSRLYRICGGRVE